jgi:hypothetical protein
MKHLKIITLCLTAAVGLLGILAAPALATQPIWSACQEFAEHGPWENNTCSKAKTNGNWATEEIDQTVEVTSSSSLELTDTKATGGSSTIKCSGTDAGWVGGSVDSISKINTTKCERITGLCESGKTVTATPIDLPWSTELKEESGGEIRDAIHATGKGPGYKIECTVGGIFKVADECFGSLTTKMKNNHSNGTVEAEFESKSGKIECSLGGKEAGEVKGVDTTKQQPPGAMAVGPPPPVFRTGGDLDFGILAGGVKKNTTRSERFRFQNPAVAVNYTSVTVVGNPFTLVNTTCNGAMAIGSTCTAEVQFAPLAVGVFAGILEIRYTFAGGVVIFLRAMPGIGLA